MAHSIPRPDKFKIDKSSTSIDQFIADVLRIVNNTKPYGIYICLFAGDDSHGYQYGLQEEDYQLVGEIANEHKTYGPTP